MVGRVSFAIIDVRGKLNFLRDRHLVNVERKKVVFINQPFLVVSPRFTEFFNFLL